MCRRAEGEGGGFSAATDHLYGAGEAFPGFAPPFLFDGDNKLAQMPSICVYGRRESEPVSVVESLERPNALQLLLTVADCANEVHDTHHPVSTSLAFEDQKPEAIRAGALFRTHRMLKWLTYFERVFLTGGGSFLLGSEICYADLALFQLVEGLRYAFQSRAPKRSKTPPTWGRSTSRSRSGHGLRATLLPSAALHSTKMGFFGGTRNWTGPIAPKP